MSKPTAKRKRILKAFLLMLSFIVLFTNSYSQQSSLTVNAKTTEDENASGYFILTDNAVQDSTWRIQLVDGTSYFPFYATGIEDILFGENIKVYPNPVGSQDVQIVIGAGYQLATIRVYNSMGKLLYRGNPKTEFDINTCLGLLLLQFEDVDGKISSKKIVSNTDNLRFNIGQKLEGKMKSSKSNAYTLTFEDIVPADPEFNDFTEQISIGDGEHKVKDITLPYSLKNIVIEGITSPDANGVVKTSTETLGSLSVSSDGTVSQQVFQYAFSKDKTLPVTIELSDDNSDQIVLEANAEHNQVIEIDTVLTYHFGLSGTACSPVGRLVEVYDEGELIGSDIISSAGEYNIDWTTKTKQLEVDSIRVTMAGYISKVEKDVTMNAGNSVLNYVLEEKIFDYHLIINSNIGADLAVVSLLYPEISANFISSGVDTITLRGSYGVNLYVSINGTLVGHHDGALTTLVLPTDSIDYNNATLEFIPYTKKLVDIYGYVSRGNDVNHFARITYKLFEDTLVQYIDTTENSFYAINGLEVYDGFPTKFIVEIKPTDKSVIPFKEYRDTIIINAAGRYDYTVERVGYPFIYGQLTRTDGYGVYNSSITFENIETHEIIKNFETNEGSFYYDSLPIATVEGDTYIIRIEQTPESSRFLNYTDTITVFNGDQRIDFKNILDIPWQKIQGTIRDGDSIDYKLEGVTVKFMNASDDSELDIAITDANGYYKSNIALPPDTTIYLLIGGKAGYYSRGGVQALMDWQYEVPQPMFASDTLVTYNWTLPRIIGKYGLGINDTITVSAFQIANMAKVQNIEHAMKRGALFNYEGLINDSPSVTSTIINQFIADFKAAFPNANIIRTTDDNVLTTQQEIEYNHQTNYYPDSVITHVNKGSTNQTFYEYTTSTGDFQMLYTTITMTGPSTEAFNKETGRTLGFGEVGYESFMDNDSGPITNRDKRIVNLILKQGQYRYYYEYDSWSYNNLTE